MRGQVIWFVGLSGAGKTTLATAVTTTLRERNHLVAFLDGDVLRRGLCSDLGFSPNDRAENIRRIAYAAELLAMSGVTVLVATISPLRAHRNIARLILPNMFQIFVDAPLHICEARDPKGLYARARSGSLPDFTGIDSPFEPPNESELICKTDGIRIEDNVSTILDALGLADAELKQERFGSIV